MNPKIPLLAFLAMSGLAAQVVMAEANLPHQHIEIIVENNRYHVSANVRNEKLKTVLQAIAKKTPLFMSKISENRRVSARFTRLPLAQALRRILEDSNYMLIGELTKPSAKKPRGLKLVILDDYHEYPRTVSHDIDLPIPIQPSPDHTLMLDLENEDASVRQDAISRITKSNLPEYMGKLKTMMYHDQSDVVRVSIVEAIAMTDGLHLSDLLVDALRDPSQSVKDAAERTLSALNIPIPNNHNFSEISFDENPAFLDPNKNNSTSPQF